MIRIEMIGPSGVGKTTLFNKLIKANKEDKSFLTSHEALIVSARKQKIPLRNPYMLLLKLLLQVGIYRKKELGIAYKLIKHLHGKNKRMRRYIFDQYHYSFSLFYKKVEQEVNPYVRSHRISTFIKKVEKFEMMKNYFGDSTPVIIDEGLAHCFRANYESIDISANIDKFKKDSLFSIDGIIACEQSADVVFAQALDRKKKGIRTFTQGHLSDHELKALVKKGVTEHEKRVNFFKSIGIPVVNVNTGSEFEENLKRINEFTNGILINQVSNS